MKRIYLVVIVLLIALIVANKFHSSATDSTITESIATTQTKDDIWYEMPKGVVNCDTEVITILSEGERNYTLCYDFERLTTLWVAYPLSGRYMGELKRPSRWYYNPLLSTSDQINLCYRSYNDDYSRGHLIPNASRNGNSEMQEQTFYVTNSVPQIQNRFNGGIWQSLENSLQIEARENDLYIVTGIAFAKGDEGCEIAYTSAKDDLRRVPVPNYFYKVALKLHYDTTGAVSDATTIGFWFEHRTYTDTFENYATSVDLIEEWTGLDLFHQLPDAIETKAETNTSWHTFARF